MSSPHPRQRCHTQIAAASGQTRPLPTTVLCLEFGLKNGPAVHMRNKYAIVLLEPNLTVAQRIRKHYPDSYEYTDTFFLVHGGN